MNANFVTWSKFDLGALVPWAESHVSCGRPRTSTDPSNLPIRKEHFSTFDDTLHLRFVGECRLGDYARNTTGLV
jgi:hypothetical protein